MSDLAKSPDSLSNRMEVGVVTVANPIAGLLRTARVIIQRTPSLRATFETARKDGWTSDDLTAQLRTELTPYFGDPVPEEPENIEAVARYLADEYLQIGDSILLVSPQTGRALAKITEADLYQPPPVPREDGRMVLPARRLKPDLEGQIVLWTFDRAHEQQAVDRQLERLTQTDLLRDSGDRRTLFTTRGGRQVLLAEMRNRLSSLVPDHCTGATKALFEAIVPTDSEPGEGYECLGEVRATATANYPLKDKRARNLRHDVMTSVLASITTGWGRSVASHIMSAVASRTATGGVNISGLREETQDGLWLASPNASIAILTRNPAAEVIPLGVEDRRLVGLPVPVGFLKINHESYEIQNREIFDRWEVQSTFTAMVWVNWSLVYILDLIEDVPTTGVSVEVTQ